MITLQNIIFYWYVLLICRNNEMKRKMSNSFGFIANKHGIVLYVYKCRAEQLLYSLEFGRNISLHNQFVIFLVNHYISIIQLQSSRNLLYNHSLLQKKIAHIRQAKRFCSQCDWSYRQHGNDRSICIGQEEGLSISFWSKWIVTKLCWFFILLNTRRNSSIDNRI